MNVKELMLAATAALAMMAATHPQNAFADGPNQAYDNAIVNQMANDPNESLVLDDGRQEDPNAKMSPTARAFVNGIYNGRKMQQDQDAQVNVPPLPPMPPEQPVKPKGYAGYPQAAQVQAIPQAPAQEQPLYPTAPPMYQPQPQQYVQQRPQAPVVVNVMQPDPRYYEPADQYGRAPSWRNRMEQQQYYDPQPVYTEPQQVYAPPPPPVYYAPPPQPVYYVQRAQPVYYPPVGYAGVNVRWGRARVAIGGYGY